VRYRYRGVLSGLFEPWFADHSADEITRALSATSVLFERYLSFAETAADARVTANPLFSRLHQDGLGEYLAPGLPTVFDGSHFAGEPAPRLGGDTADVLTAGLGLSVADITRLTDAKTIAR
jgi:2-methylfumaryl-CoA isomerase